MEEDRNADDQKRRDEEQGEAAFLEVTLDVEDDNVRLCSIAASQQGREDPQPSGRITLGKLLKHSKLSISQEFRSFRRSSPQHSNPSIRTPSARSSSSSLRIQAAAAAGPSSLVRSRSGTETALKGLRYISRAIESADQNALWQAVETRFNRLARDGLLDRADFGLCIGMPDSREFAGELFDALARRQHQTLQCIDKEDLYDFWLQLSDQSFDSRIQIFFDMCDKDADGRITEEEVKEIIILSASANKLSKLNEQAEEYAALIMEELDPHGLGYIELWQLESLMLSQFASVAQDGYSSYSQNWSQTLVFQHSGTSRNRLLLQAQGLAYFLIENWQRVWVMSLWICAMAALFVWKFLDYRSNPAFPVMGYCLCSAKGAAETLKLNMALVLLPVCRNSITWLRSTFLGSIIPFNDNLNFHKEQSSPALQSMRSFISPAISRGLFELPMKLSSPHSDEDSTTRSRLT